MSHQLNHTPLSHANEAAATVLALPAWAAQLLALTQETNKFPPDFAARQHVDHLVNRLVRDSAKPVSTNQTNHGGASIGQRPAVSVH